MNCKGFEQKRSLLNFAIKLEKETVIVAGMPSEDQTKHVLNASSERYS
jgi:hypothetical protein